MAYNAYEKGLLPHTGGTMDQPALFTPLMASISSAIEDERRLEEKDQQKKKSMIEQSQGKSGPVSLLHGPPPSGFAKIPTPNSH